MSIGAFEAFTKKRYGAFFESAYRLLPTDGRMFRFLRYLTGCADFFRHGITDVGQFTLVR